MPKLLTTVFFCIALYLFSFNGFIAEAASYSSSAGYQYNVSGIQGRTIVIDPGHGGSDTGAIGESGLKEKEVTLAIAQELRRMLEGQGAKVLLTRSGDRDVAGYAAPDRSELQARANIANRSRADLFVSIHADAFEDSSAGGTTTYFFPKTGSDAELASHIQQNVSVALGLTDRGYRSNDFFLLDHTNMPAVLVEVAFLSNPAEEKALKTKTFRQKAAQGIYEGIAAFFKYR